MYALQIPPWLNIAYGEVGIACFPPGSSNPRIREYHAHTDIRGYDDKAPWCSSFVNWTLAQVGIKGTGSALAKSWLEWGVVLEKSVVGCITILWREEPSNWKGHVGYFLWADAEYVCLLGGNQLEQVKEHVYPLGSVLGYRWPSGYPLPD